MLTLRLARSRRASRTLCAALALALVVGNACASLGICIAKAPAATVATGAHCVEQADGPSSTGTPASAAHCPQEDSGPQARTADLPAVDVLGVGPALRVLPAFAARRFDREVPVELLPPKPLHARLNRLLL
jgi:hypothetical protein